MKRIILIALLSLAGIPVTLATHNRAGEITLTQVDDFTYEILIQTFTYSRSAADRDQLDVMWGDGSITTAPRFSKVSLPNFYFWNRYQAVHTYPGPGTYTIVVQDPNRNYGVINIPNSVNVIFSVKTTIAINPGIGNNNTPVLLNPPIDKAARGQVFVHNPAAFDPDGDSISYRLTVCTEENGEPIQDYSLPLASDSLYIDHVSGDLVWDTPVDTGIYNIAIEIEEWRRGVKIGSIDRDMQIDVYNTNNRPPVIMPLRDFCLEAGERLEYDIVSTDPDSNRIAQYATGGPFLFGDSPATFDTLLDGRGFTVSRFTWQTTCNHVRHQPYNIIIRAVDDNPSLNLVDISNFHVKVIGPAPENLVSTPTSNTIDLAWDAPECQNIEGYEVYRHAGRTGYIPDTCSNGLPGYTGYSLVGYVPGRDNTAYLDNNGGEGLEQGIEYCYILVPIYEDGTSGYPSEEVCDVLIPGTPAVLQASVETLDPQGEVLLTWARPRDLDTIPGVTGPFEYILYRSDLDATGRQLSEIHSFSTSDLNDTVYLNSPLNTLDYPYSYSIELYNDFPGNRFLIGKQEVVSTTWLEVEGSDNANLIRVRKNTPWVNDSFVVYRQDPFSGNFDSIGVSTGTTYLDSELPNGQELCYRVRTRGRRTIGGIRYDAVNFSHLGCGTPQDKERPCPPTLQVTSFCDSNYNFLAWTNPNHSCADDVVKYHILYSPDLESGIFLIDSTLAPEDTTYFHHLGGSLAGCYAVTAIDSFNNVSDTSSLVCVDNCIDYKLPNVFTPNGDGINDYFRSSNPSNVELVDMKIFNRWGHLVFKTDDPEINWDGKRMDSDKLVSPGVYYYVCDVYEHRLTGLEVRNMVGFIYLFTEEDAVNVPEK